MSKRKVLPQVLSSAAMMETELLVAEARELSTEQRAAADAVRSSLNDARAAAKGEGTRRGRLANWWNGTQIEGAYRHLHAARVELVDVYDTDGLAAETPRAIARVQAGLHPDDPRRLGPDDFADKDPRTVRASLRRLVEDGYEASDEQHERLRSFRNITLLAAVAVVVAMVVTLVVVARNPTLLPLCFEEVALDDQGNQVASTLACPSGNDVSGPSGNDILIVALMGFLGGLLSAVFSLRHLRGTSAAYDAPVALAVLKPPLGALTAVLGLVLVHGDFVPGLSALDSQGQILAYALLFGVAQQLFTRLVDQKAQSILDGMPSKDAESSPGEPVTGSSSALSPPSSPVPPDLAVLEVVPGAPGLFDEPAPEELAPNPEVAEGDKDADGIEVADVAEGDEGAQDDGSEVMADTAKGFS